MTSRPMASLLAAIAMTGLPAPAAAQTVAELQQQIDALKAQVQALIAAQSGAPATALATPPPPPVMPPPVAVAAAPAAAPVRTAAALAAPKKPKPWYDRITVRGYTQLRLNEIVSGDRDAPAGRSSLRSVHDAGLTDANNFSFRRIRLVFAGDLGDHAAFSFQPDFATAVSNQSVGERREGFAQLRDAYVDLFLNDAKSIRLRFGQSKVPFGWENLQSSSNRLTLDRSDAINAGIPSERDIGVVGYVTPPAVQAVWDRLEKDGQKLFGNYGAFGLGLYNGQGVNRTERNNDLLTVAMATWPFALDGLGDGFGGQVLELGGAAYRNRVQPEIRAGGVSARSYLDERIGLHAILYPQPLGFQAEWSWGRGPEYVVDTARIETRPASGGYVQTMLRVRRSPLGALMPYARWQRYRGGWKAATNAPRLETNELELGVEFQPVRPLELTLAYARMRRREADERLAGRAEGSVIRTQLQWNY